MIPSSRVFALFAFGVIFASACDRSEDDVDTPTALDERSAGLEPTIDANGASLGCAASAKCPNGTTLNCDVPGAGTCSGVDGVGVQCIAYAADGTPEEFGGTCPGQ
jgi:hypothetical protein